MGKTRMQRQGSQLPPVGGDALLRIERDDIVAEPTEADLEALRGDGFVAHALDVLRAGEKPADADALRLMHRLVTAERG
jgi:hypothetical protein